VRHPWRCYTPPSSAENTSNREVDWWDVKSTVRYSLSNCSGYQTRACLSEALCSGSDRARDGSGLAVDALWRLGPQIPVDSALADHLSGSPADTWNGPLQSEVVAYVVFRVRHGRIRVDYEGPNAGSCLRAGKHFQGQPYGCGHQARRPRDQARVCHVPRELKVELVPQELGVSIRALRVGNVPSRRRRFLNVVGPLWGLIASQALIWALLVLRT